ncbi:MAG: hypothetical protein SWO11_14250 [Thermodesulfobacteriota bacterium]|nr:hypothetical protein [Thermodesulfobacteriota bacterium]
MRTIQAIALLSFREAIRDRVLYSLFVFSLIVLGLSNVIETLVVAEKARIIKDIGFGGISIIGLFVSISVCVNIFSKELRGYRSSFLFSKPVSKGQFLLGKYIGALIILGVMIVLMGSVLLLNLLLVERKFDPDLLIGLSFIFIEFSVVTSFTLLFSNLFMPITSGILTFAIYVFGHLTSLLQDLFSADSYAFNPLIKSLFFLLPDLDKFNLVADIVYHTLPSWQHLVLLSMYGVCYICSAIVLSWFLIRKKDIK